MKRLKAFTLAEVLITLAIIGVVAAISIPSVISNTQQQEFKTGLRKAVSVLNSAITMNMAIDGESPYDNADLMAFLMRHMSVSRVVPYMTEQFISYNSKGQRRNSAFYTTDGMRFEFWNWSGPHYTKSFPLYENPAISLCTITTKTYAEGGTPCYCGSYGLNNNPDGTTKPPCIIMVDVNGDRKPSPQNASCKSYDCAIDNYYKQADPLGTNLTDIFSIMITEKAAIPYGVAAQRAMYQAQAKK